MILIVGNQRAMDFQDNLSILLSGRGEGGLRRNIWRCGAPIDVPDPLKYTDDRADDIHGKVLFSRLCVEITGVVYVPLGTSRRMKIANREGEAAAKSRLVGTPLERRPHAGASAPRRGENCDTTDWIDGRGYTPPNPIRVRPLHLRYSQSSCVVDAPTPRGKL